MHVIAAKAICLKEAMMPDFVEYQQQIVDNAAVLARTLQEGGVRLVSGGTDNHLMLADVGSVGRTGREVQELLEMANITANKNMIPFDKRKPVDTSGVRLGTPAITTRGMKEAEAEQIGKMILKMLDRGEDAAMEVQEEVIELCAKHPLYPQL